MIEREAERQLHANIVQRHEDDVEGDPEQRLCLRRCAKNGGGIAADEEHDDGRRDHVLDVLGQAGEKAAPWSERGASERVGAAGVRHGGAHLGEAEREAEVHDGDDDGGEEHAAPAALRQAEVPT